MSVLFTSVKFVAWPNAGADDATTHAASANARALVIRPLYMLGADAATVRA
jgi:hypothetical protein